jgi:hypothetical protein
LEQIDHTCRKKIGSNISLNHSNAVEGLKIDWKQLIWIIRHGLKHKHTVSNNWATKLQSRVGKQQYKSLAIMTNIVCSNQQVGNQNPRNYVQTYKSEIKTRQLVGDERKMLAITWTGHY